MYRSLLLILSWLLVAINHSRGQDFIESSFDHYTTADGMSHDVVTGLAQDPTGYMWIGSAYGLNRFNGSRFIQFHSDYDSLSLPAEDIAGMTWLDKNRLASFTSGLFITDTKTGHSRNLYIPYHNQQYQFKYNMIERAMGDENGNTYVLTRSGFYHYDKNYELVFRFDYYTEEQVPVTHFYYGRGLFELDKNRLLIVSIDGLFIYNRQKREFRRMIPGDCPQMDEFLDYPRNDYQFFPVRMGQIFLMKSFSDSILYLDIPKNKKVWSRVALNPIKDEVGWRSKLTYVNDSLFYLTGHLSGFFAFRFSPHTGLIRINPVKNFASYFCSALVVDKEKNIWIGTTRGLFRQNPHKLQVQVARLPTGIEELFPNIRLDDIVVANEKVYAGGRGNAGLFIYDKKTFKFEQEYFFHQRDEDPRVNHIRAIVQADESNLLIGTLGPIVLFDMKKRKDKQLMPPGWHYPGDWTSDLYKDRNGSIWVSSSDMYKYEPGPMAFTPMREFGKLLTEPFLLTEDTGGHMWMAGHGLARYNRTLDSFDIVLDTFPFIRMPDKQINAMAVDRNNTVWFNSNNNGLAAYNIATGKFRLYTKADGLPADNFSQMMIVGNKLWIAAYSTLVCFDLTTSQVISFGEEDGFPDMPITKGAKFYFDEAEQQLYVGFATAIVRFNPNDVLQRRMAPHTFIESLDINGKDREFLPGNTIHTSWQNNSIRITIGTINFSDAKMQRFAYRILKNGNTPWTELGTQSSFNISSLSPGRHAIQVKAFSLNNRWPDQVKEISIVIAPPFWQEAWFIALMFALTMLTLYLFVHWRIHVARKKEMEKTHIQKLKADDYKNQFELEHISNYFSSSLADKITEDEVLWDVASNLIGKMNYVDCMIYLWNEDKTKMVQKAAFGPKGKPEYISAQVFDVVPGQGVVGYVMETKQPVIIQDTRKDPRYRIDEEFRLSEICVPIIHNDELMGIIDSEHYDPNYFSERDIKILTTIATLIANKLKQIESEKSLEVKEKELTTINEQLAEARLSALQAQMNPHFVFNALNSIKRMILESDNEKASRYLSKFALMIRMTLNHSKEIFVTLDENIAYLKAYLEMEQLRFDDSFTYSIGTSDKLDLTEITIPSMMIQPIVENAIWHGLLPKQGEKQIRIRFTECGNKLTCVIEDNGIGIRASEQQKEKANKTHHSVGLENLKKRIKIMNEKYEMGCSLRITDVSEMEGTGTGTRVTLQFNLINA